MGCALVALGIQMLADPFIMRPWNIFVWLLVSLIASLDSIEAMPVGPLMQRRVKVREYFKATFQ